MKYLILVWLGIFLTQSSAIASESSFLLEKGVEEVRLDNGMTFLLMKHGETPVFSAYIRYKVGGLDEPDGSTGVAHLIEHMAFKGTQQWGTKNWEQEQLILAQLEEVGQKLADAYADGKRGPALQPLREQLDRLYQEHQKWNDSEALTREYQRRGGLQMNATTSQDVTTYFINLPSSELEFWAEAESDRLFHPVFREFYRERDVVMEEWRMRVVDDPGGAFYRALMEKSFVTSPYARPTIGFEDDLMTLTRTKAEQFFQRYYRPELAVGAIVGRFDVGRAKKILARTFGKIPPRETGADERAVTFETPPLQRSACRVDITRQAQPRLAIVFHKPNLPSQDDYVFDLMAAVLTADRYARLYRSLVLEKQLAVSVDAYPSVPGSRLPNLFMIYAIPRIGVPLDRLYEEIMAELTRLSRETVPADELKRAQKHLITQQIWNLESNESVASDLSYFQSITGDWRYSLHYPDVIASISADEIQAVAQKYLTVGNRCLGFLHGVGSS
jgi:predicted Zn-dependent peptidase